VSFSRATLIARSHHTMQFPATPTLQ
jgi:hypothetical protein